MKVLTPLVEKWLSGHISTYAKSLKEMGFYLSIADLGTLVEMNDKELFLYYDDNQHEPEFH